MIYYIYRINFLCGECAGRYYLGMHSAPTWKKADAYTGSGNFCKRYFKKYGKDNTYTKDILNFADTREELFDMENIYIGDLWKNDPLCVNMKSGGEGGSDKGTKGGYHLNFTEEHRNNLRIANLGHTPWNKNLTKESDERVAKYGKTCSETLLKRGPREISQEEHERRSKSHMNRPVSEKSRQGIIAYNKSRAGTNLRQDTKDKLSLVTKDRIWITLNGKSKRVFEDQLQEYLDNGWERGRAYKRK